MATAIEVDTCSIVTLGRGGWTQHMDPRDGYGECTCSGYGRDWANPADHRAVYNDDAIVVSSREIPYAEMVNVAYRGPMVSAHVAAGEVNHFSKGRAPWMDDGTPFGRTDLGPVQGFDTVAPDVYAQIIANHGGTVMSVADAIANGYDPRAVD